MLRFKTWSQKTAVCILMCTLCLIVATADNSVAGSRNTLWQSREQFTALETQENSGGKQPAPNSHPVTISRDQLVSMLSSLDVRPSAGEPVSPLFTSESLDVLVPQLQTALQQATPGEDVTFAVIGLYRSLMGLAKSPKVTTGRLFVQDGRVNVIFGLIQQDVNERVDRRLEPFTPGTRTAPLPGEWRLLPPAGLPVELVRKDWVVFGTGWLPPVAPVVETAPPDVAIKPSTAVAPVPERRGLQPQGPDRRSPADRLMILNDLRGKGLISDEEYRTKRQSILNEL